MELEQEISELSNTLLEIYAKNLEFLKNNFEEIFYEIDTLSKNISSEQYKEKYSLEYRDGFFDILNLESNSWYYFKDSYEDADARANAVNFTNEGSLNLLRIDPSTNKFVNAELYKDVTPINICLYIF